jgi:TldD protein
MTDRRQFLKQAGAGGAALAIASAMPRGAMAAPLAANPRHVERFESGAPKELMMEALNAAKSAGASWADARIARFRQNFIITREHQIVNCVDTDTLGCGVRALVDGCWGFAATRYLTTENVTAAAREAVSIAKANQIGRAHV